MMVANGFKARTKYIKERKMVQVSGLLHCELVTSDRLLLNGLSLKIVFHRRRGSFILMADDASRDCRVRIIEAQLCVRYVKLPDKKYRDIQQFLLATSACYSIKRYEDTFRGARNIKFELGECSCRSITKQCLWLWWIMMHKQEVLQRTHSISNILTQLKWTSI